MTGTVARLRRGLEEFLAITGIIFFSFLGPASGFFACMQVPHELLHSRYAITRDPKDARTTSDILATLARVYREQHSTLPDSTSDLELLGHFSNQPLDPWGRPFRYWIIRGEPIFGSLGADGTCGGAGIDADVFSDSFVPSPLECEYHVVSCETAEVTE
jgi:hypothetical protein